jgi:hypothetical protein
MPIKPIVLQRRHAELGRIRLGNKGDRGQPQKLDRFRFTSPSETYIRDLAELYGGDPRPWNNNGKPEFEVYTEAKTMPVIAVKGGLSQWMEFWSGGGCVHRCDGETNVLTGAPCDLDEKVSQRVRGQEVWVNPHTEAKPTTRLSVMLPELEAIGVWRLESHGWNAAAEIPAVAELAQYVGDLVPAVLHLVERRSVKDGRTSRFVVPVLDLRIGASRLREIAAEKSGLTEISAPAADAPKALGSSAGDGDLYEPYFEEVEDADSLNSLGQIWERMKAENLVGTHATPSPRATEFFEAFKARAALVKPTDTTQSQPDADGVVDAEIVPDAGDADAVWNEILRVGGEQGMSLGDVEDHFASQMGGLSSAEASAAELSAYLQKLQAGVAA